MNTTASIPIIIEHPARFGLPKSARVPIVVIAGGTGIAPFLALLEERSRDSAAAETLVLFAVRSEEELVYDEAFAAALRTGRTTVLVVLSREKRAVRYTLDHENQLQRTPFKAGCGRISELSSDPQVAAHLWDLLRSSAQGGLSAHVYVCGRSRFARSAIDAIERVFLRFAAGDDPERALFARDQMRKLFAEGRLKEETFSGEEPASNLAYIEASEVARHNNEVDGYWLLIDHRVYDLSEFVHRHPGGKHVLLGYAGMDATEGYNRVHARRPEVDASREMHLIGLLRVPQLRERTAEVATPGGPRVVSLSSVYRAFLSALWLTVEMQNALRNDQGIQACAVTRDEKSEVRSLYRLQRALETHERFLKSYMEVLTQETLPRLSELTRGFFARAPTSAQVGRPNESHVAFVASLAFGLSQALAELASRDADESDPLRQRVLSTCRVLEEEAAVVLDAIKEHVRMSVRWFEQHEGDVSEGAVRELLSVFDLLAQEVHDYWARVYSRLHGQLDFSKPGFSADLSVMSQGPRPEARLLAHNSYWTLDEDAEQKLVTLRRSALAFQSIHALLESNEQVIACVRPDHGQFGIVVDMRQAPGRNDPAFEQAMRKLRKTTERQFARLSVLVESTAGMLQVSRLVRSDGAEYLVTTSEIAAIKFARGEA